MPQISICIPVYKTAPYLERCLDSILKQKIEDIEIIIVNDASPDNSKEILKKYAQRDRRIQIIDKPTNEGLMSARRDAYSVAQGKYIMFVDSDDYLEDDALSVLYSLITDETADIAVSGFNYYSIKNTSYSHVYELPYGNTREGALKALLKHKLPHMLWANLYHRNLFDNSDLTCFKNQTNGEDMILFYELVNRSNKIVATHKALYAYCQNTESSTQIRLTDENLGKLIDLNLYWYKFMKKEKIYPKLVEKYFISRIFDKCIQGYDISLIRQHTNSVKKELTWNRSCARLGMVKGLIFQVLYNQLVPLSLMKIIKNIFSR